jgi:hypothetical protein
MDINEEKGNTSNQTDPENPPLPIPPIETPNHKSNSDDSDDDKQIELKKSRPKGDYKFITEIVVAVTAIIVAGSSILGQFKHIRFIYFHPLLLYSKFFPFFDVGV